jgi:exodeoxyribonuclease V alpha subunit
MATGGAATRESLEGTVEHTTYHDPNTRYTVLRLHVPGRLELVTAVGRTDGIEDGAEVTAEGEWSVHPKHGEQFAFDRLTAKVPTTRGGIKRRLMLYPGIRDTIAERILDRFGLDVLDLLNATPHRLMEVEGIGQKTYERILEHHQTRVGPIAELEDQLMELGLSPALARVIHRRFGDESLETLRNHPYRLAREVRGIGFRTADRIARALGIALDSDERIEAGLVHVLEQAQMDGHCALPPEKLQESALALLQLPAEQVEPGVLRLLNDGSLLEEQHPEGGRLFFLRELALAETNVAEVLADLALTEKPTWKVSGLPDELSEGQVKAVEAIAKAGVVILTGGPGTGKSTVVRHVLELAQRYGMDLHLAAPTGRAAKRLEQATGEVAKTVHRLLEIQGDTGTFFYNANNPLSPGMVVVDESSMLDVELAESLLTSLTSANRLMLVGDADQLPSVGPGNVLRDLIRTASGNDSPIPVVRLTKIFRQSEGSSIIVNAHRILEGNSLQPDKAGSGAQFFVLRARDAERAHEMIVKMASERIPEAYGLDPVTQVQVLCPMHKGRAGTEAFNRALQAVYTKDAPGLEVGIPGRPSRLFRVGDRVMQTRNDYDRNVFNGDIGTVIDVDEEDVSLTVEIDAARVYYEGRDLLSLQLAYAVSIHKSQGSEFPAVLIPILNEHHVMLRRNLLYTAITRARQLCVIVGDPRAIERAILRSDAARRHTGLAERLRASFAARLGTLTYVPDP